MPAGFPCVTHRFVASGPLARPSPLASGGQLSSFFFPPPPSSLAESPALAKPRVLTAPLSRRESSRALEEGIAILATVHNPWIEGVPSVSEGKQIVRRGFGLRKEVAPMLARDYESSLVECARAEGNVLRWPGLELRIAQEFGFCYGVDRAIDYAYETRKRFPNKRLFLTGEIIHNPSVNQRLHDIGYRFLDGSHGEEGEWEDVTEDDILLIPAFGVSIPVLERMRATGALLVDTTCGSVLNVWRNVERYAKEGFTCLIHGKWDHEETRATASRALVHGGGYLIVRDLEQAERVAGVIERRVPAHILTREFVESSSAGFDAGRDLQRIGMANQTTMLSSESLEIAERMRAAIGVRYGENAVKERFRAFDTICSATEDRQAAVLQMLEEAPEVMIIIGGYNSSNTGHLAEICSKRIPTYHVKNASELLSAEKIRHQPAFEQELVESEGWLPARPLRIGITAGASTPDREVGAVIRRLLELRGIDAEL